MGMTCASMSGALAGIGWVEGSDLMAEAWNHLKAPSLVIWDKHWAGKTQRLKFLPMPSPLLASL